MKKTILVTLVGLIAVLGCKDDPAAPRVPSNVVGTYVIQTLNGSALPGQFSQGLVGTTILLADTVELKSDATFRNGFRYHVLVNGIVTQTVNGATVGSYETYVDGTVPQGATAVVLRPTSLQSQPLTAYQNGDKLEMKLGADTYVYSK